MAAKRMVAVWVALLGLVVVAPAADWPHWLGPNHNGSTPETGLLTDWPEKGPTVLWKIEGGDGYSSVAVVGGRAYTLVQRGGDELAIAIDVAKGKELWVTRCGPAYKNQYGNGPRSTPTLDGKYVYVQSVNGTFLCLEADGGKIVWQHDLFKDFDSKNLNWGVAASPRIDGERVYVIPGGKGAGVAAYHKTSGELLWKTGDDKAGYATPIALTVGQQRQAIFFTAEGLLAVQADDGKELWRVPWKTEYDVNICTPLLIGDRLFVASGEQVGCAMLQLKGTAKPSVVWESRGAKSVMKNYWANAVLHDKHLYGLSGEFEGIINLNCVEVETGKLNWSKERFGKGAITLADGHLFITTKLGDLVLVQATPKSYQEKARISKFLGDNRTVPTISGKKMFLRDRKDIYCLDIGGK